MEAVATPISSPEQKKRDELWNEYLLKCCEYGQKQYHIKTATSQLLAMEKELEVIERKRNEAAANHDKYLKEVAPILKAQKETQAPKLELTEVKK